VPAFLSPDFHWLAVERMIAVPAKQNRGHQMKDAESNVRQGKGGREGREGNLFLIED
jgi:hypothetical protein